MPAQPLRFTCNIRTLEVTDRETGEVTQCRDIFEMATVRRNKELAAMPAVVTSPAKARRLAEIAERKAGGA